jgi:hypothetical protein
VKSAMAELPRLLDRHLAGQDMTREQFAAKACELGWYDTTSEVLEEFDAWTVTYMNIFWAAEEVFGLSEGEAQELRNAADSDVRKRMEANRRVRSN